MLLRIHGYSTEDYSILGFGPSFILNKLDLFPPSGEEVKYTYSPGSVTKSQP
jgi:hypothetical protein